MGEADIHTTLSRQLSAAIESDPERGATTYGAVHREYSEGTERGADILLTEDTGQPLLVLEAKAPERSALHRGEVDPFEPRAIRHAGQTAREFGAPYFARFTADRLAIFDADEEGSPLLERCVKAIEIGSLSTVADTLLDELAGISAGERRWDTADEVFVARLRSLHELLVPDLETSLAERRASDAAFRERFSRWADRQGVDYEGANESEDAAVHRRFASQAGYLLLNKLLFYEILQNAPAYDDTLEPLGVGPFGVADQLEEYFAHVVETVGFEAVFAHDEIYSEIPLEPVSTRLRHFVFELRDHDLSQFDTDVIGRIYEGIIPPDRRREMGEYYTPPAICDLLARLTIEDADDAVLDPACGSGGVLLSAYNRKRDLLDDTEGAHARLLDGLYGIDINRFPAHLAAINLTLRDLDVRLETAAIEVADFFEVAPGTRRSGGEMAGGERAEAIGDFDAVVGNPPYVRQEAIPDTDAVRAHLDALDATDISRRADMFVYFLTHATQFLAEGGRLGYIVSDRWLDTSYGADVQSFLLSHFEIEAVVTFDRQVFDDALVDSSLLVLHKQSDPEARAENVTSFLRVRQELDIGAIVDILDAAVEADRLVSTEEYRLVTRTQQALAEQQKWTVFFYAPPLYFEFTALADVVELSEVADVSYGHKTGANPFFVANTAEWAELGLAEYVSPLLKATGQVERVAFTGDDAEEWAILDIHDLVQDALAETDPAQGGSPDERVLAWLATQSHDALVAYIEDGREAGYPERSSLQHRDVWFDLGPLTPPPMVHTQFTWREHRVVWNEADVVATNQFHCIRAEDCPPKLLCALLNTRLVWLAKELTSRRTGGQGMTRLQTMVYETEQLPIPHPGLLSETERGDILAAFEALLDAERTAGADGVEAARDALDRAVLACLGMDASLKELKQAVERLVDSRETAAGKHTSVLVERSGETAVDLPGEEW